MKLEFHYRTLRTPIDTVNLLTAGGLRMGSMTELYGPNASGKSSIAYQMARFFQKDYSNGQVRLIDSESSADYIRLKTSFGLDLSEEKFSMIPIANLEEGFSAIVDACNDSLDDKGNEKPILLIWDTIAVGKPAKELEVAFDNKDSDNIGINAGGMNLRSRVIEHGLAVSMTAMSGKPVTLIIINQIRTTGFGSYTGPTQKHSSGGVALKHYVHYKFHVRRKKSLTAEHFGDKSERKGDKEGTLSEVEIEKSKYCPAPIKIEITISDKLGGVIVPDEEILSVAKELKILKQSGGWWKFPRKYGEQSLRWSSLVSDRKIRNDLMDEVARYFRSNYFTIDELYKHKGKTLGKPETSHAAELESLFDRIDANDPFAVEEVSAGTP